MRLRRGVVAAGSAVVLAAAVGCGSGGGSGGDDGVLRVGLTGPPSSLDPYNASAPVMAPYLSLVYDRLTVMAPGRTVVPGLATEWVVSADGLTSTFTVRDDAKFSDGSPVDAEAVAASLNRARDTAVSRNGQQLAVIESVTATGPDEVAITTTRPAADLPYLLSGVEASIVNPALFESGAALEKTTGGSGPYTVTEFAPGDRVEYAAVADYWDTGVQRAPVVTVRGMPDGNARLNAFRSGQLDMMFVTASDYGAFRSALSTPGLNEQIFPAASFYALQMNLADPVMSNVKIRQAINYAIDREGIVSSLLNDRCEPISGPIVTDSPGAYGGTSYTYDPDRARALVAESGLTGPIEIDMIVPAGSSTQQALAVAIQSALQEIGIATTIASVEVSTITQRYGQGGVAMVNSPIAYATDGMTLQSHFLNKIYYPTPPSSPEFTALVTESLDPALSAEGQRARAGRAAAIASAEAYDGYICAFPTIIGYNDTVTGVEHLGQADFRPIFDLRALGTGR